MKPKEVKRAGAAMCIFADPFHSTGAALKPQQGSVQDSEQMLSERHVRIARKSRGDESRLLQASTGTR